MGVKFVEPVPAFERMRHEAVAAARVIYHGPGRAAYRRKLATLPAPATDGICVNFGWIEPPVRAEEVRIGGGVKLAHLRERFGETAEGFNVLYLVSSLLHLVPQVEELVAWAKRRGVAVVWNQNGVAYPAWCGAGYPWFNEPMRRLIAQADHVVYQSAFCRDCADRYLGPSAGPAEVLWNPVDLARFTPAAEMPPTNVWELLAMGTNHAFYRVKASLDALAALVRRGVSVRLTIAGEFRWEGGDAEVSGFSFDLTVEYTAMQESLFSGGARQVFSPGTGVPTTTPGAVGISTTSQDRGLWFSYSHSPTARGLSGAVLGGYWVREVVDFGTSSTGAASHSINVTGNIGWKFNRFITLTGNYAFVDQSTKEPSSLDTSYSSYGVFLHWAIRGR